MSQMNIRTALLRWRQGWDSNPRVQSRTNGFQDRLVMTNFDTLPYSCFTIARFLEFVKRYLLKNEEFFDKITLSEIERVECVI